jgi:hypothetical protein
VKPYGFAVKDEFAALSAIHPQPARQGKPCHLVALERIARRPLQPGLFSLIPFVGGAVSSGHGERDPAAHQRNVFFESGGGAD